MERSYIAFISYKHTEYDAAIAKQVHRLIENYVIPKSLRKGSKKLGIVFRDEEELPVSSNLTESICTALDASQYLIVICSPESKESPWVAREVNYFLQHHDAGAAFVVLVKGEPQDVFPYELTHVINKETGECEEVEPLAMDVRDDSIRASLKKTKIHMKKLYAGMLGCSYDSLVQREKTRRMKRIAALATVCVMLAGSFMGMLFAKNRALEQKNEQLTEAIQLALSRESELLATEADEAFQNGDVAAAIRHASDALYSDDIQRPYNPHAERVLFSAIDVLQNGSSVPLLSKIALEHQSPIESMAYSTDGRVVYAIDAYGTVRSFDTSSGDCLWSVKLKENDNVFLPTDSQLWYDVESDFLCCCYNNILFGLDTLSGQTVWETQLDNSIDTGLVFNQAGQTLSFIERCYSFNLDEEMEALDKYYFTIFSTRDGSLLKRILIMEMPGDDILNFSRLGDTRPLGVFAGSDYFVGTVGIIKNDISETMLYIVDLSENTTAFVENGTLHHLIDYSGSAYIGNDRVLVLSETGSTGMNMQCFDLKDGALLWENIALPEEYIYSTSDCRILPGSKKTVIASGTHLLVIVNDTGEVQTYTELNAEVIDLYWLVEGLFGFTLADGCCAAGWCTQYGVIHLDLAYLPATSEVLRHNNGFIQAIIRDSKIEGFLLAPVKDGGSSVTYLSEDRCTAFVATVLDGPQLPSPISVDAENPTAIDIGKYADANLHGTILLGPVNNGDEYALNVLDTENHVFSTINVECNYAVWLQSGFLLTEDDQNVIVYSSDGNIDRIKDDGSIESLSTDENIPLVTVGDMSYLASKYVSDAARLASDGRIVAAICDGQKITFWMDGMNEQSVQIPDDIRWAVTDGIMMRRCFRIGENGLMVLSDFTSDESATMEHFAAYDLSSGKWKLIDDVTHGSANRTIAFGQTSPIFAVYDQDMNIRIYDYNAAETVHSINIERPAVSVVKIGMLLEDQYLYVFTKDGQFMVYNIATNEMVFWTVIESASDFLNWFDPENNRLYVQVKKTLLCIDVSNWEQLFKESNVEFFSPARNEVYISDYDLETSATKLKAISIPSTAEMVEIARNTVNQ